MFDNRGQRFGDCPRLVFPRARRVCSADEFFSFSLCSYAFPGPPGSGKTATISNAVKVWANRHEPVWIVAQSNVGVKNIAESLCRRDVDFRLVVSKEFYVEWYARTAT